MHLLDLTYWLVGALPIHSALLRTNFWETPVEDNAVLVLGTPTDRGAPWSMLHASWTEWKNEFVLETYCRRAKLQVAGLWGSYGTQTLRTYRMAPELGPPSLEEVAFPAADESFSEEWRHLRSAIQSGKPVQLSGDLASAHYALSVVEEAYRTTGYAPESDAAASDQPAPARR
jgi:predicted dehydrogenase